MALGLADMDRDGLLDVITAGAAENSATVALNAGNGNLRLATNVVFASSVASLVAIDMNNDGVLDFVAPSSGTNKVYVALGDGMGGVKASTSYLTTSGSSSLSATAADFNNDGRIDVVTANQGTNDISVLLNTGDANGTLAASTPYAMDTAPRAVLATDFNNDGKLDVAITANQNSSVAIRLGRGDGTFNAVYTVLAPQFPLAFAAGDVNGDGNQDIVVAGNSNNAPIRTLLGRGDGTFTSVAAMTSVGSAASMQLGDFNADGKVDVVILSQNPPFVTVALGNGTGAFNNPVTYAPAAPTSVILGDINGDGKQDLIVSSTTSSAVNVALGVGDGTFGTFSAYRGMQGVSGMAVGDFDRDGAMDVAAGGAGSGRLALLLNRGCMRTTPGSASPFALAVVANPNGVTADGVSATTVSVTVTKPSGAANPNQIVNLSVSGGNNIFSKITGFTNSSGVFTSTLKTTVAETKTVRALAIVPGYPYGSTAVTFVAGGAANMSTRVVATPKTGTVADNISSAQIAVSVADAFGNPVSNQMVVLSSSAGDAATFGRNLGVTDPNGIFATTVTSTLAGAQTISATVQ
jgi:hypothetical protein